MTLDLFLGINSMLEPRKFRSLRCKWGPTIVIAIMALICMPDFGDTHEHKKPVHAIKKEFRGTKGGLQVIDAWVRASPAGAKNGAAYATVVNHISTANTLIAAASPAATKVELHTHKLDDGIMRMRRISGVTIPGHGSAKLQPGGDHMMLLGLKRSLKAGDHIMLTLTFRSGNKKTVRFVVMKKGAKHKAKHSH